MYLWPPKVFYPRSTRLETLIPKYKHRNKEFATPVKEDLARESPGSRLILRMIGPCKDHSSKTEVENKYEQLAG